MEPHAPRHILVPDDFSEASRHALAYAATLARALGARLTVLHVGPPIPAVTWAVPDITAQQAALWTEVLAAREQDAHRSLAHDVAPLSDLGVEPLFREGEPSDVIVDVAGTVGADLIVMGSHGRTGLRRALLGSVAERTARHAACPVLIVR